MYEGSFSDPVPALSWPSLQAHLLFESVCMACCTSKQQPQKRIPEYCSKRHVHCRLMGKAMTLPAGTTVTGHYQSQIMLSNTQLSAILPTASNFYCKQIESMIFTFSLSFTSVPRLVPSQGTRYPCQLFTPYSHQGRCLFQLQGRQPEESVPL